MFREAIFYQMLLIFTKYLYNLYLDLDVDLVYLGMRYSLNHIWRHSFRQCDIWYSWSHCRYWPSKYCPLDLHHISSLIGTHALLHSWSRLETYLLLTICLRIFDNPLLFAFLSFGNSDHNRSYCSCRSTWRSMYRF